MPSGKLILWIVALAGATNLAMAHYAQRSGKAPMTWPRAA